MLNIDQTPRWSIQEENCEIFCVQFSDDSNLVASGLSNGNVSLRSATTGRLSYSLQQSEMQFPVTSVRFNPKDPKIFIAASADGIIREWTTKNSTFRWTTQEVDNQIYALDFQHTGSIFASAGRDCKVRIYDFSTKKIVQELSRNEFDLETTRGHCNRIYSLKFNPEDTNMMLSGGWDDTIQVWDLRAGSPVRAIFGPHICGDSIDISRNNILACSWRTDDQIQLFDIRTFTPIQTIKWPASDDDPQCLIYSAKFVPNGKHFLCGGSGVNQVRIFSTEQMKQVGTPLNMGSPVFSICMPANASTAVIGAGNGTIVAHPLISTS